MLVEDRIGMPFITVTESERTEMNGFIFKTKGSKILATQNPKRDWVILNG